MPDVQDHPKYKGSLSVQFQLDDSWDFAGPQAEVKRVDVRSEAEALRFITSAEAIRAFTERYRNELRPFTLSGSGDFHHLSAVWLSQFSEPFTLISLDNHPDWDIRPPKWSCGAWINRSLEMTRGETPLIKQVQVWGCGGFECHFPWRLLGNRKAAEAGRLKIYPWRGDGKNYPSWLYPIDQETWRETFAKAIQGLAHERVYLTIDLDVMNAAHAVTNWEPGQMTRDDVLWAVQLIQAKCQLIGGDICGGYSTPIYKSAFQKLAGWFDHPGLREPSLQDRSGINGWVLESLWPLLCHQRDAGPNK